MGKRAWYFHALELAYQIAFYTMPLWYDLDSVVLYANSFFSHHTQFFFYLTCAMCVFTWCFPSLCYAILYKYRFKWAEKYRLQEWVWEKPDGPRKEAYMKVIGRTISEALVFGQMILQPTVLYFVFKYMPDKIPNLEEYLKEYDPVKSAWQLGLGFIYFETIFYWFHRMLHTKAIYPYHKDHHAYYVPVSVAGLWGHVIDGLLTLPLPGIVPIFVMDFHLYTFLQWSIVHTFHSQYDHGGYDFPFNPFQLIPFASHTDAHNFHHSHNVDNYGLYWRFWDILMGTDQAWKKFKAEKEACLESGKVGEDMKLVDGVLLSKPVAEEKDIQSGEDLLNFTMMQRLGETIDGKPVQKAKAE